MSDLELEYTDEEIEQGEAIEAAMLALLPEDVSFQAVWQAVLEWARFTDYGVQWLKEYDPERPMPVQLYGTMCYGVGKAHDALRWIIGDILNYGDGRAEYAQFEDAFGYSPATLDQYRRVAGHIPLAERPKYAGVPWTALQITAHLDGGTRDALLDAYTEGEIEDTGELRDEVRALRDDRGEDDLLPPCPLCGGHLTSRKCKGCGLDFPAAVRHIAKLMARLEALDG